MRVEERQGSVQNFYCRLRPPTDPSSATAGPHLFKTNIILMRPSHIFVSNFGLEAIFTHQARELHTYGDSLREYLDFQPTLMATQLRSLGTACIVLMPALEPHRDRLSKASPF